jgi:hypothetical protein
MNYEIYADGRPLTDMSGKSLGADKNTLSIAHREACNLYSQEKYKEALEAFAKLAAEYKCDYLSAYWAGMSAVKMGEGGASVSERNASHKEGFYGFGKALDVNPNYKPALAARAEVE